MDGDGRCGSLFLASAAGGRAASWRRVSALQDESAAAAETSDKATSGGGRGQPLFLGHVVTRRFKYRWLVLAVSAFTSMAIIVIVSVVYSNR